MYFLCNEKMDLKKILFCRTDDDDCVSRRIEFVKGFAILLSSLFVIEKKRIHFD
jgi:hypothetical protein